MTLLTRFFLIIAKNTIFTTIKTKLHKDSQNTDEKVGENIGYIYHR